MMNFFNKSIKSIAIGVVTLSVASCGGSDSAPAGSSVPSLGTVVVDGQTYTGIMSTTTCVSTSTGEFSIGLSQSSATGQVVIVIVVLGDTPKGNKTYNIQPIDGSNKFTASDATLISSVATLTNGTMQTKNFRAVSGTVQASLEDGKVVVKFSNVTAKSYNQANVETGQTIMASQLKCDK